MDRTELLRKIREARTPNEYATAISSAREWLRDHPEDADVQFAMIRLLLLADASV